MSEFHLPRRHLPALCFEVRLLKRETLGLLQSMSLTVMTDGDLMIMGTPPNLLRQSGTDIAAVDREGALLLKCTYKSQRACRLKIIGLSRYLNTSKTDRSLRLCSRTLPELPAQGLLVPLANESSDSRDYRQLEEGCTHAFLSIVVQNAVASFPRIVSRSCRHL